MDNNIKVSCLGLDGRCADMLRKVFERHAKNIEYIEPATDADVVLMNLRAEGASLLYRNFRKANPATPLIGLYKDDVEIRQWEGSSLKMPLDSKKLVDLILSEATGKEQAMGSKNSITEDKVAKALEAIETKQVAAKLGGKAEPSKAGIGKQREFIQKQDEMCFAPERFLLGHILEAVRKVKSGHQGAVINCWGDKSILIEPANQQVVMDLTDNQLRNLAIAPLDDRLSSAAEVRCLDAKQLNAERGRMPASCRTLSLEVFLWDMGLQTCKGRIPVEVSITQRHYLRRWPNVTRMKLTDNALKIIAYWVRQPCSLDELHQKLDVPYQDIFSVYTAAWSAGLAAEAQRQADKILEAEEVNASEKRGLFNSLISRLKKMNKEAA